MNRLPIEVIDRIPAKASPPGRVLVFASYAQTHWSFGAPVLPFGEVNGNPHPGDFTALFTKVVEGLAKEVAKGRLPEVEVVEVFAVNKAAAKRLVKEALGWNAPDVEPVWDPTLAPPGTKPPPGAHVGARPPTTINVQLVGKSSRQAPRPDMGRILGVAFDEGWGIDVRPTDTDPHARFVTFNHPGCPAGAPLLMGKVTRLGTLADWSRVVTGEVVSRLFSGQAIVNALARESPRALRQRETAKKAKR